MKRIKTATQSSNTYTIIIAVMLLPVLFGGCSEHGKEVDKAPAYMLYSPNGEPLNGGQFGKPTCETALSGWFTRLAQGESGISKERFMSDARAQFAKMDIDKNGHLVSEELERYRLPFRQEQVIAKTDSEEKEGKKKSRKHDSSKNEQHDSLSDHLIDPVMSADSNLDFQVTLEEFLAQAADNFNKLDSNHDAVLSRDEITASCHKEEKP
jgi:hypothetical protein